MKLFDDQVTEDSVFEEIDRICKSNPTSYSPKAKAARVNAALYRFYHLAFEADRRWNFDDVNETTPPIDTQNLVSGTNRYKIGTFTEKVINVIRVEVLNSAGTGRSLTPETINTLNTIWPGNRSGVISSGSVEDTFQELYVNASSGTPTHYIKYGDFIYLRPNPNYSETDGLKIYFNRPATKCVFTRFTVTVASPGVFTATAHGLSANDTLILESSSALPTGLAADTTYYVISTGLTAGAFQVSTTLAGTGVNVTVDGSGVHSFLKTNFEPGVPTIYEPYLARHASLPYLLENRKEQAASIRALILEDEQAISNYFGQRDKDVPERLIPYVEDCR